MVFVKRALPTAVAIAAGLAVLASMFTSLAPLELISTYLVDLTIIIAAFALLLGLINVLRVHGRRVRQGRSGRFFSLVLIAAMLLVLLLGLIPFPGQPSGPAQPAVRWIFANIQAPIQASLSALLVFFVVTSAYRLLRVRSAESLVMLIAVVIVLVGQISVGILPILPEIKDWILGVPAMAGVRGILLGVALGVLLTSIRLLLGVERPYSE
jgi:hypothetical protein